VSQDSLVSKGTRLWAGRPGFNSWWGQWCDIFSLPLCPDWLWDPHSLLSNGLWGFFH